MTRDTQRAVECVVVQVCVCVCVECGRTLFFRARGIEACRRVQRSASTALDAGCTQMRLLPQGRWSVEGGGEWKSGLCGVVHVRVYLWHSVAHSWLRHAFTCRQRATMPEATQKHTHVTRDTERAVECVVVQV